MEEMIMFPHHRFPCCGKAYPCDICHDSKEDHPMERASRMICGYCSREQVPVCIDNKYGGGGQ